MAAPASIQPDIANPPPIHTGYSLRTLPPGIGAPPQIHILNFIMDVAVPAFTGPNLILTFGVPANATGHALIHGVISDGQIRLTTDNGVTAAGPIVGGPPEALTFVGTGNWVVV